MAKTVCLRIYSWARFAAMSASDALVIAPDVLSRVSVYFRHGGKGDRVRAFLDFYSVTDAHLCATFSPNFLRIRAHQSPDPSGDRGIFGNRYAFSIYELWMNHVKCIVVLKHNVRPVSLHCRTQPPPFFRQKESHFRLKHWLWSPFALYHCFNNLKAIRQLVRFPISPLQSLLRSPHLRAHRHRRTTEQ